MLNVTLDNALVLSHLDKLANVGEAIDFAGIGEYVNTSIKLRTAEGEDVHGNDFADYSEGYRAYKSKTHVLDIVNLQFDNDMLGAMLSDSDNESATIYFADEVNRTKAMAHNNGTTRLPQREFFGVSDNELKRINTMADNDILRFMETII